MMKQLLKSANIARSLKHFIITTCGVWLISFAAPTLASCEGCLCPGDPCQLCPLPAVEGELPKPNEPEICARIREKVPPTYAQPGANEYFPNLDRSVAVCVSEGGDVIRNRRRSEEFPSRVYCKPPTPVESR